VLYNDNKQKLGLEYIQAGHAALNDAFSNKNEAELSKVPDTGRYPWKDLVGNANIQFLPLDPSKLAVEYLHIPDKSLDNSSPVEDAANRAGIKDGIMNIYLGNSTQRILGQAELGSNIVFALYAAIGNATLPGELNGYHLSKTLVHEIGHALSLPHTFSDDSCDHQKVFPDVPEQVNPNFQTQLLQNDDGDWYCTGDNRFEDRIEYKGKSCLNIQDDQNTAPNEMGINYMDYGADEVSIIFTKSQALMMRSFLKSEENTKLTLLSAGSLSTSSTDKPTVPDNGIITVPETETTDTNTADNSSGGIGGAASGLTALTIVLIVLVTTVIIAALIGFFYYFYKQKKTHHTGR
jgi:hypothetical protein